MATDAEIRARGINFLSPQRYLQNEFQLPTEEEVVEETGGGIPQTQAFTNNVGGGNTFNSNELPSYRPNYDYRQFSEYGSDPSTEDIKQMDMNQNYFNKPPVNQKMQGLMSMIPYAGSFMKGAKFLGDQISPYLPVNRRSIMENELAGQGVMVDDIGRIVQGSGAYNTAANVMAGYSPYHMTAETFDKRISKATEKMKPGKYKDERIAALEEAKTNFLNTQGKTDKIYDFEEEEKKRKKKNTVISRFITNRKKTKTAKDVKKADETSVGNYPTGGSYDTNTTGQASSNQYGTYTPSFTPQEAQDNQDRGRGQNNGNMSASDFSDDTAGTPFAKGGRVGYFFGGRVNYKDGGLASIL